MLTDPVTVGPQWYMRTASGERGRRASRFPPRVFVSLRLRAGELMRGFKPPRRTVATQEHGSPGRPGRPPSLPIRLPLRAVEDLEERFLPAPGRRGAAEDGGEG